jgi:cytochrome c biogenesis protein CcmG/thiol:disulfide interchange protein DsbE
VLVLVALGLALVRRTGAGGGSFGVNSAGRLGVLPSSAAANFTLTLGDHSTLRLEDLRGRAVVLNFWASWCVPCRDEAPILARLAREYSDRGVTVVGISLWDAESDSKAFLSQFGVDYPSGSDIGGRIAIEYGVTGLPETYFVRPDGTLSRRWIGPLSEDQLRTFIDDIRPLL